MSNKRAIWAILPVLILLILGVLIYFILYWLPYQWWSKVSIWETDIAYRRLKRGKKRNLKVSIPLFILFMIPWCIMGIAHFLLWVIRSIVRRLTGQEWQGRIFPENLETPNTIH